MNERNELKARILAILKKHLGKANPITMLELHAKATGEVIWPEGHINQTRFTRSIIRQLRMEGLPICNRPGKGGGYFWAQSDTELEEHLTLVHKRAISSLTVYQAMRHLSATELVQQLELDLNQTIGTENDPT